MTVAVAVADVGVLDREAGHRDTVAEGSHCLLRIDAEMWIC